MPSPSAILELAIAELSGIDPSNARAKFQMRMVMAALHLVRRAIELQPAFDAAERARLAALLAEEDSLEALNRRLCALIGEGALTLDTPGLAAHLRATTMAKLAIDQPSYAAYRRALAKTEG